MAVDLSRPIRAGFARYGIAASYQPPAGAPVSGFLAIVSQGAIGDAGFMGPGYVLAPAAQAGAMVIEIMRSAVAAPVKGGTITLSEGADAGAYTIMRAPELDETRLVWRCVVKD